MINPIIIGNKTVQQNDINWSNRILGKEALTQIKINMNIHVLSPKLKLWINPKIIANWEVNIIKKTTYK